MLDNVSGLYILVVLATLLIGLGVHEAMHAFAAHALGDDTAHREGRLTLNPLAHIDIYTTVLLPLVLILMHLPPILAAKPVPFNPDRLKYDEFGAALVSLAGPLTNLGLAVIGALVFHLGGTSLGAGAANALYIFTALNIGIFVFNLIPIPPLDGSRVLYAVAPEPVQAIMRQIESLGFLVILFIFLFAYPFIADPIINLQDKLLNFLLL